MIPSEKGSYIMIRKLTHLILLGVMLLACDRMHHYKIANEDYRLTDHELFIYRCEKSKVSIDLLVYSITGGLHMEFTVINKGTLLLEYDLKQISVLAGGEPYQVPKRSLHTEPKRRSEILRIEPNDTTNVYLSAFGEEFAPMPPLALIHLGRFLSEAGQIVAVFDSIDVELVDGQ